METINGISSSQVLEALRRVEQRIEETRGVEDAYGSQPYWDFGEWASCTCGHIYAVATGEEAKLSMVTQPAKVDGLYQAVLHEVAEANGVGKADAYKSVLHSVVSDLTSSKARDVVAARKGESSFSKDDDLDAYRVGALTLVRNTIMAIEARHEMARRQVAKED